MKKIDRFIDSLSEEELVFIYIFIVLSTMIVGIATIAFFPMVFVSLIILGLVTWMINLGYRFYKS